MLTPGSVLAGSLPGLDFVILSRRLRPREGLDRHGARQWRRCLSQHATADETKVNERCKAGQQRHRPADVPDGAPCVAAVPAFFVRHGSGAQASWSLCAVTVSSTCGGVSKVCSGAGDGTVHSSPREPSQTPAVAFCPPRTHLITIQTNSS